MQLFLESIGFGIVTASVLAIAGVGFTIQVGIANMFNLTYGTVMMIAAFVAYGCNAAGLSIWVCLPVAAAAGGVLTALLHRGIFRPFLRRGTSPFAMVIVTVATGFVLQYTLQAIWGSNYYTYRFSRGTTHHLGPLRLTTAQLWIIALAALLLIAMHLLLSQTKLGKAMRATAADPDLARACGIQTDQIAAVAWTLTGALCGLGGVALVMSTATFDFTTGASFMIVVVAAAVLGGVGLPTGAMVGALIVGLGSEIVAAVLSPDYKDVVAFGLLIVTLLVRPQGLLAGRDATTAGQVEALGA